jgi:peptidoglycan hydrolase-like protein with peptidoglycan-binding domain
MAVPKTIDKGDKGPEVELAQYELCRDLYLGGPDDVDADFGALTDQAVRAYQTDRALTVDGIVGPLTWTKMLSEHPNPPTLARGATGSVVSRLQQFLNIATPPASPTLAVDGDFGPLTKGAVEAYQAAHSVPADGIVGYKTWVIHIGAANAMVASQVGV